MSIKGQKCKSTLNVISAFQQYALRIYSHLINLQGKCSKLTIVLSDITHTTDAQLYTDTKCSKTNREVLQRSPMQHN